MELNLNHLRSFYVAVTEGSVSAALDSLTVTQPVFAGHLKSLERAVGVRLVVYDGDSLRLTQTGESVFRKASRVFKEVRETEALLEEISLRKGTELKIGCPEVLESLLPPRLISDFEKLCPGVRVLLTGGRETTLTRSVEDGRNDLALIRYRPRDCRLKTRVIGREELMLVASPSSTMSSKTEISVRELADKPLVVMKEGFAVREVVFDYLQRHNVSPNVASECSSNALLKELVGRDKGIGFVETSVVQSELDQCFLKEVRIAEGPPRITIEIAYPHRREISPAARAFLRLIGRTRNNPTGPVRLLHRHEGPRKDTGERPQKRHNSRTDKRRSHGLE